MEEGSHNHNELVGRVLDGRYRIIEPLGEGGMGVVYVGEHVLIGRRVAIKVLGAELASSEDFAARFKREAIAAGRLDHPNCVPVTDSGQLEDGTAYIVMELVTGRGLGELIEEDGPQIEPIRALRIVRHVLRGLAHAHEAGIVHRDIKPDNVMMAGRDEDPDFARVLDFGIAKLRDSNPPGGEALTQVGMAIGTPSYLSPEQALGGNIDHRSDLYSVAVLLFEMVCGRPPYVAQSLVGVLTKHASAPIPHLWEFAPELTELPQLDAIMQRGLAKERDERYASATEFVHAIDQVLVSLGSMLTPIPGTLLRATTEAPPATPPPAYHTPPPFPRVQSEEPIRVTEPAIPVLQANAAQANAAQASAVQANPAQANITAPHPAQVNITAPHPAQANITAPHPALPRRSPLKRFLLAGAVATVVVFAIVLSTRLGGPTASSIQGLDQRLQALEAQLEEGESCDERLEAVQGLLALGDKRAIPSLKKARRRMRGGVLGIGEKNANRCLRKAARAAIKELEDR